MSINIFFLLGFLLFLIISPTASLFSGEATAYKEAADFPSAFSQLACGFLNTPIKGRYFFAAINSFQYDQSIHCGQCAKVVCTDSRCSPYAAPITVMITDKCADCKFGDLDLSFNSWNKLTNQPPSRFQIQWEFTSCSSLLDESTPLLSIDPGANENWVSVQISNYPFGISSVRIKDSLGDWKMTTRKENNFFYADFNKISTPYMIEFVDINNNVVQGIFANYEPGKNYAFTSLSNRKNPQIVGSSPSPVITSTGTPTSTPTPTTSTTPITSTSTSTSTTSTTTPTTTTTTTTTSPTTSTSVPTGTSSTTNAAVTSTPSVSTSGNPWRPCVIDTTSPGMDIADNAQLYPDPFAWYINTNAPGVTLIGPDRQKKCGWKVGQNFVWNERENTCILNGQGYPIDETARCGNAKYSVPKDQFINIHDKFQYHAFNIAKKVKQDDASIAYVTNINIDGQNIEAAMALGHGVLSGLCGDCFLLRNNNKYVALLQVDVRAWSLEISTGAATWIAADNYGGTCYIPDVLKINCESIYGSSSGAISTTTSSSPSTASTSATTSTTAATSSSSSSTSTSTSTPSTTSTSTSTSTNTKLTFSSGASAWWMSLEITNPNGVVSVRIKNDKDTVWQVLQKQNYGPWTGSMSTGLQAPFTVEFKDSANNVISKSFNEFKAGAVYEY